MPINPNTPRSSQELSGYQDRSLEEEGVMHAAFDEWAESLLLRNGSGRISILPYSPEDSYQQIDVVKAEALRPRIETIFEYGCAAIGKRAFPDFVEDLRNQSNNPGQPGSMLKTIEGRLAVPKQNVALITSHADLLDIGVAQAGLFCALENTAITDQNAIIVNKLITRLTFDGIPAVDLLRASGNVYFCLPRSGSAQEFEINEETTDWVNGKMLKVLLRDMHNLYKENRSMLLTVAPSGSTAKRTTDPVSGNLKNLEIPQAHQTTVNIIQRHFNFLLPVSLRIGREPDSSKWHIGAFNSVKELEHFNEVMQELANQTADLYKTAASYGEYTTRYKPYLARKLVSTFLKIEKSGR